MAREVVWTEPAWDDLAAAADYIARDSENYAAAQRSRMTARLSGRPQFIALPGLVGLAVRFGCSRLHVSPGR